VFTLEPPKAEPVHPVETDAAEEKPAETVRKTEERNDESPRFGRGA
jgi:hypothetical protein